MTNALQDRVYRAQGLAARAIGQPTHAFRPAGSAAPLAPENRFLRLPASFHRPGGYGARPRHGDPMWQGLFDAAYTRPGDYLVQEEDVYFVVAQPHLGRVLCAKTNRVVHVSRPAALALVGANPYAGGDRARDAQVLVSWPASMTGIARAPGADSDLPGDAGGARLVVMLPASVPCELHVNDTVSDDLGRHGTVQAAELTDLGWRLLVAEARV